MPTHDMPAGWVPRQDAETSWDYIKGQYCIERLQIEGLSPEWYWSSASVFYATPYPDPLTCAVACELFNGGCDAQEHNL